MQEEHRLPRALACLWGDMLHGLLLRAPESEAIYTFRAASTTSEVLREIRQAYFFLKSFVNCKLGRVLGIECT